MSEWRFPDEAVAIIREMNQEEYKLGRLDDIPEGEAISFYKNGEFMDLCAGTHVSYTKKIKAFKLLQTAGSYHRGDASNKQLQRIYGTAFATKDELAEYLEQIEEAKKRDHRNLGRDLGLFHIDEMVGQGLVLWKPNGAIIRQELENLFPQNLQNKDILKSIRHILVNLICTAHRVTSPTIRILNILRSFTENA